MNTTSMEFVIAQEKTNRSPSVLSEFMGISKHMSEALQVNPWNLGVSYRIIQMTETPANIHLTGCRRCY